MASPLVPWRPSLRHMNESAATTNRSDQTSNDGRKERRHLHYAFYQTPSAPATFWRGRPVFTSSADRLAGLGAVKPSTNHHPQKCLRKAVILPGRPVEPLPWAATARSGPGPPDSEGLAITIFMPISCAASITTTVSRCFVA